jgi:hypothetical protein
MVDLAKEWLLFARDIYALTNTSDTISLCLTQKWAQRGTHWQTDRGAK